MQTAEERDKQIEGAVLRIVLDEYPGQFTEDELLLAADGSEASASDQDALERALGELDRAGLVHRKDSVVWPTRPARYFDWLGIDGSLISTSRPIA